MARRSLRALHWDEAKHPRDDHGKFAHKGGGKWLARVAHQVSARMGDIQMGFAPGQEPRGGRLKAGVIDTKAISRGAPRMHGPEAPKAKKPRRDSFELGPGSRASSHAGGRTPSGSAGSSRRKDGQAAFAGSAGQTDWRQPDAVKDVNKNEIGRTPAGISHQKPGAGPSRRGRTPSGQLNDKPTNDSRRQAIADAEANAQQPRTRLGNETVIKKADLTGNDPFGKANPFGEPGTPIPHRDTPGFNRALGAMKVNGSGPDKTPTLARDPQPGDIVMSGGLSRWGRVVRSQRRNGVDGFDVQWQGKQYTDHYPGRNLEVIDMGEVIRRGREGRGGGPDFGAIERNANGPTGRAPGGKVGDASSGFSEPPKVTRKQVEQRRVQNQLRANAEEPGFRTPSEAEQRLQGHIAAFNEPNKLVNTPRGKERPHVAALRELANQLAADHPEASAKQPNSYDASSPLQSTVERLRELADRKEKGVGRGMALSELRSAMHGLASRDANQPYGHRVSHLANAMETNPAMRRRHQAPLSRAQMSGETGLPKRDVIPTTSDPEVRARGERAGKFAHHVATGLGVNVDAQRHAKLVDQLTKMNDPNNHEFGPRMLGKNRDQMVGAIMRKLGATNSYQSGPQYNGHIIDELNREIEAGLSGEPGSHPVLDAALTGTHAHTLEVARGIVTHRAQEKKRLAAEKAAATKAANRAKKLEQAQRESDRLANAHVNADGGNTPGGTGKA